MGIEPTGPGYRRGPTGFEDQARHQTGSASGRPIIALTARPFRSSGARAAILPLSLSFRNDKYLNTTL
jgi:hypothetical protein